MTQNELRQILGVDAETVLAVLTRRQHLHPHAPLHEALRQTVHELGCCPEAVRRAVERLGLDGQKPIGRLRRTELTQLARSIYRIWGQNLTHATAHPLPQS